MTTTKAATWDKLASDIENRITEAYARFKAFSEEAASIRPTPADWSAKEIVGHLIDSASNNHQRFVRLQITDGLSFPEYGNDNDRWVKIQKYQETAWDELLTLWRCFNRHIARVIRSADTRCIDHIWVVDEDKTVTLGEVMIDYLRHLDSHIAQIDNNMNG